MKLEESKYTQEQLTEQAISQADKETQEIEEAYNELHMLREVMETANFSLLIGDNKALTEDKLPLVHGEINRILKTNKILQESGLGYEYDGRDVLRQFGKRVSLSLNSIFSASIAGLLGWAAVAGVGVLSFPISAILAGAASLFAIAGLTNNKAIKSIKAASEVVAISDLVAESKPINQSTKRSVFQQFWDNIRGKSPKELKEDAEQRAEQNARRAGDKLEKAIAGMPETIKYVKQNGKIGEYAVWKFFNSEYLPPRDS